MQKYELMIVIQGQIPEDLAKEVAGKVKKTIEDFKAKDLKEDFWGRRKLAYKINHQEHGYYDVFNFSIEGKEVENIEKELRLLNEIIRFMLIKREDIKEKIVKKIKKVIEEEKEGKVVIEEPAKEEKIEEKPELKELKEEKSKEKESKEESAEDRLKGLDEKIDEILKD